MQSHHNWLARAALRIGAHLVLGAASAAIVGALCIGAAGALIGGIMDIRSTPPSWSNGFGFVGAWLGLYLGAFGGLVGALSASVVAFDSKSRTSFAPLRAMLARVALGQLLGTVGALSCYFVWVLFLMQTRLQPFVGTVEDNVEFILWGAPLTMICGAIAGALWKREANR